MSRFGECFNSTRKYIAHPSTGWLTDDDPCDAGSVQILDQNLSVLGYEGCRHLFWAKGRGAPAGGKDAGGYDDLGIDTPPPQNQSGIQQLSWGPRVCASFGPYAMTMDATGTYTAYLMRAIRVAVYCNAQTNASMRLFGVLTQEDGNPWTGAPLHYVDTGDLTSGVQTKVINLTLGREVPERSWVTRAGGSLVGRTRVRSVLVWVGWRMSNASDRVYSISGYEVR
jgi:hypothetical protein